jgi:hypothetical protein
MTRRVLAERIRGEVEDLERVLERSQHAWLRAASAGEDQDIYIGYAAAGLQSFYTGMERVFQFIAEVCGESIPAGEGWHTALLQQMAQDRGIKRPCVLSAQTAADLGEFRRFRHVVRNIYVSNLNASAMASMFARLPALLPNVRMELLAFADFLELH